MPLPLERVTRDSQGGRPESTLGPYVCQPQHLRHYSHPTPQQAGKATVWMQLCHLCHWARTLKATSVQESDYLQGIQGHMWVLVIDFLLNGTHSIFCSGKKNILVKAERETKKKTISATKMRKAPPLSGPREFRANITVTMHLQVVQRKPFNCPWVSKILSCRPPSLPLTCLMWSASSRAESRRPLEDQ